VAWVAFKPKKSVALSGVTAGNTALCTVGRTGNDLHYRGYDILDVAEACEFEEIAHLLVHGTLPNQPELAAYKAKLKSLRGVPNAVLNVLEELPPQHPPDGRDAHGGFSPGLRPAGKGRSQPPRRARYRRPADGLARLHAAVLVPFRAERQTHRCGNRR
jgi:citrate synthase